MPYVGLERTVTKRAVLTLDYVCERCGWKGVGEVPATGVGSGSSPFFLDNEGAADRASDRADEALLESARSLRGLVPCPRCHRRQPGEVTLFLIRLVGGGALIAAFFGVLTPVFSHQAAALGWITGAGGALLFALHVGGQLRRWVVAKKRLVFTPWAISSRRRETEP